MLRAAFTVFFSAGLTVALLTATPASEGGSRKIDAGIWARFLEARHSYKLNCAPCHGIEGAAGLTPYAPAFALGEGLEAEFGMLLLTVQEGVGFMPPWQDILSYEEQDWNLFYAIALRGDNVFRNQCATCHEGAAPRVPETIPRGEALTAYQGPIHVTNGTDVPRTWNQEEQVHVIEMLRALAEER